MKPVLRGLAALAASVALLAEGPAPDDSTRIFAVSGVRASAVKSYTFALHVDFGLRSFPYLKFHLDGTGKWERPNLYSIHFRNVPWFGKGFESISLDPLEPSSWPVTYDIQAITHDGDRHHIEMTDKTKGHIKSVLADIDPSGLRKIQWNYLNGGTIAVNVMPHVVDGVPLPETEDAEVKLPGYHVVAHARFDEYKLVTDAAAPDVKN